jgi:hypothetical protein
VNPGPIEEAGATARGIVDALKAQPAVLALIVANFALLFFIYYALQSSAQSRDKLVGQVLSNSNAIHTMLQQRSVSCPDPTFRLQDDESKPVELPK